MAGYPHMTNLVIGIPFSGKPLPPSQTLCYSAWIGQCPMNYNVHQFHTMRRPIAEARNYFAQQAVENKAKYLAMWDEDVVCPPYWIKQLIYWLEHHEDWGMVGGVYCMKGEPAATCAPMVFRGHGKGPFWKWRAGELFQVDAIATGLCVIRVDCFKDVKEPWFKTEQDYSPYLDNIPKGTLWTEDLWWCDQLKKTGKWKIYADGSLICGHMDLTTEKVYGLPPDSYPMHRLVIPHGKKKILDIGCGEGAQKFKTQEGEVVGVDIRDVPGVDFRVDVTKMPFATGTYDICHSSHVLEHFPRSRTEEIVDEWIRVMKPDGEFRLIVPNLEWAAKELLAGKINRDVLNVFYGEQDYPQNIHYHGFTPKTAEELFKKRGFKTNVTMERYNIYVRATKATDAKKKAGNHHRKSG